MQPMKTRIPENPKYKNVKSTIDTGASLSSYLDKLENIKKYYKFRKDELFKRMKCTTFVQLVIQVVRVSSMDDDEYFIPETPSYSARPDTADQELSNLGNGHGDGSPAPSLVLTDGDFGRVDNSALDSHRSTLLSVARGVGELDLNKPEKTEPKPLNNNLCPYLLLDVRDADLYHACHLISALNYSKANLSKSQNYETKEMLSFKNHEGRIIIVYDEDEKLAPVVATTLVERGYDNIFLLSGGMKVAYQKFPSGFITGTIPEHLVENQSSKSKKKAEPAKQDAFTHDDVNTLELYLDNALKDHSTGSRLSKASTVSSRTSKTAASSYSSMSTISENRPPFK